MAASFPWCPTRPLVALVRCCCSKRRCCPKIATSREPSKFPNRPLPSDLLLPQCLPLPLELPLPPVATETAVVGTAVASERSSSPDLSLPPERLLPPDPLLPPKPPLPPVLLLPPVATETAVASPRRSLARLLLFPCRQLQVPLPLRTSCHDYGVLAKENLHQNLLSNPRSHSRLRSLSPSFLHFGWATVLCMYMVVLCRVAASLCALVCLVERY